MRRIEQILTRIVALARDDQAVSAVEYAVVLSLIVLVAAGTIQLIGGGMMNMYTIIQAAIP